MTYTPFQFLRGNTAQNNAYTGQPGEITVDTELNQIRLHDGVTAGGHIIATQENASLDWNDIVNRPNGLISSSQQYSTGSFTGSFAGLLTASGHLLPTQNEQFDLGSPSNRWRSLYVSGSTIYLGDTALKIVNGQLIVVNQSTQTLASFSGSFTGSLLGTSSYALSASYVPNAVSSWDDLTGKPTVVSSSTQISYTGIQDKPTTIPTASYVTFANVANKPTLVSSSGQVDYNNIQNKPTTIDTASYVTFDNIASKPTLVSQSSQIQLNAISGVSFSNQAFYFPQDITVEGKITAQEYHTEYVSASIVYQSGSTKFGDSIDDIHQITGSIYLSGSLIGTSSYANRAEITDRIDVVIGGSTTGEGTYLGEFIGNLLGTSSYAMNAEKGNGFPFSGSAVITGSLLVSGSGITGSLHGTASNAVSSSYSITSSYSERSTSASRATSVENIDVIFGGSTTGEGTYRGEFIGSLIGTSSYALNAERSDKGFPFSGSAIITGSLLVSGSGITGSLQGTASNALSSSYSITSSYVEVATSSSRSVSTEKIDVISGGSTTGEGFYRGEFTGSLYGTASFALNAGKGAGFPFSGSAEITGSLLISGSGLRTTGSIRVFGDIDATGGFLGTSSYAQVSSQALFVLQNTFTGSFKGDGSQLYFNTLNTSQSSNSQLVIGNIYNNYQYKQTTVFRNAEVVISGSTTITNGGVLFMTPQEAPAPITGGIFFSSSGQFFIGTE